MRVLAGVLGIIGALGTAYVGLVCRAAGSFHPTLAEVVRVGWVLVVIAASVLVLNVGVLAPPLPRRANSMLAGVGFAAMAWLGWLLATIASRVP